MKPALLGIALAITAASCAREPVDLSIGISAEEPAPSVGDALRRHFEPRGVNVSLSAYDNASEDSDAILADVLSGEIDLGIMEEPAKRVPALTTVAPLYPSILHVLYRRDRPAQTFPELIRDQQIYTGPVGGAAHRLLLQFAADYMLEESDFVVLPDPWRVEPDVWFVLGGLLPLNQQTALADYTLFSFGSVERLGYGTAAEGLALKYPNVRPFVLPEAVYSSLNDDAVLTLATRTVLAAREDLDPNVAYLLARDIFENAHAIAAEYQLANDELNDNFDRSSLALPLHQGARLYIDKDEPTLLERYAEVIGVGLTVAAALGSGLVAIWRMNKARRKDEIDVYYRRVLAVSNELKNRGNDLEINKLSDEVKAIQEEVFGLLIAERLNVDESLTLFSRTLNAGIERDRRAPLRASGRRRSLSGHPSQPLGVYFATHQDVRAAPDPDFAVLILLDLNAPSAPDAAALSGHVGRFHAFRLQQPLGDRRVQTPGHRIFANRSVVIGKQRPDLELRILARRIEPGNADVHAPGIGGCGFQRLDSRRRIEQDAKPAPGPLSIHAMSTTSLRSMPRNSQASSAMGSSTAPLRKSGGAANANRGGLRRIGTKPAPHSCTTRCESRGRFPASSHAAQLPKVGCPANGISRSSVKMRAR